jgi:hypothetical protein
MLQNNSITTTRIRLHTYDNSEGREEEAPASRVVAYIPGVGEYFNLSSDSSWFKVLLVVHHLYPGETVDIAADVYAERVERAEAIKASGYKGKL